MVEANPALACTTFCGSCLNTDWPIIQYSTTISSMGQGKFSEGDLIRVHESHPFPRMLLRERVDIHGMQAAAWSK